MAIQHNDKAQHRSIAGLGRFFFRKKQNQGERKYFICGIRVWKKAIKRDGVPLAVIDDRQLDRFRQDMLVDVSRRVEECMTQFSRHLKHEVLVEYGDKLKKAIVADVDVKVRDLTAKANMIQSLHQRTFLPFKNIHQGRDIVVMGAGPSLAKYEPIPGAIHIGVNKTFQYGNVELDYLFLQDYGNTKGYIDQANAYRKGQCQKFYGILEETPYIPETRAIEAGALRYFSLKPETPFYHDISSASMAEYCSVIFPALQFALYTNPKRIFLVGCDSSDQGLFDGKRQFDGGDRSILIHCLWVMRKGWLKFKDFVRMHYPETEIISVNPVGLKGLFHDISYPDPLMDIAAPAFSRKHTAQIYLLNDPTLDPASCLGRETMDTIRSLCGELDMNILWQDRNKPGQSFDEEEFIYILSHCDALILNGEDTLTGKNLYIYLYKCRIARAFGKKVMLINCNWSLDRDRDGFLKLFDLIAVRESRSRENLLAIDPDLPVTVVPDLGLYSLAADKEPREEAGLGIVSGDSADSSVFRRFVELSKEFNVPLYVTRDDSSDHGYGDYPVLRDACALARHARLMVSGYSMAGTAIALGIPACTVEPGGEGFVEALLDDAGIDKTRYFTCDPARLTSGFVSRFMQDDHRTYETACANYMKHARASIAALFRTIRSQVLS